MKSPKRRRALAIVAVTVIVGCSSNTPPATTPSLSESALRIYATSAALPLVTDLTNAFSGVYAGEHLRFETRSGGYRAMLERLLDGETPYFVTNYLPADSPLLAWPIAQDGIAVIVHPNNPVTDLSPDQLRAIFQGQVSNWRELGGPNLDLVVISREDGSGTRAEFETLVMGRRRTTFAARIAPSSTGMIASVAATPGGIGYVSLAFLDTRVRALRVAGVPCTLATIRDNTYPLRTTVFMVGLEEPMDVYREFIGWAQSTSGQAVVARRYSPLLATPVGE
jgi:phosphate transport system substrate-binding protein